MRGFCGATLPVSDYLCVNLGEIRSINGLATFVARHESRAEIGIPGTPFRVLNGPKDKRGPFGLGSFACRCYKIACVSDRSELVDQFKFTEWLTRQIGALQNLAYFGRELKSHWTPLRQPAYLNGRGW